MGCWLAKKHRIVADVGGMERKPERAPAPVFISPPFLHGGCRREAESFRYRLQRTNIQLTSVLLPRDRGLTPSSFKSVGDLLGKTSNKEKAYLE